MTPEERIKIYEEEANESAMDSVLDCNEFNYHSFIRLIMIDCIKSQTRYNRRMFSSLASSLLSDWMRTEGADNG